MFPIRYIKESFARTLPSLDQKCSPNGCWYCSDLCQHCMQPSPTLYSGVHENGMLLKFCSEECKKFWFPDPDQQPHYVACYLDEICQAKETAALLMTVVNQKKSGVEQVYLSIGTSSEGSKDIERLFIVWHIREVNYQHFAHFYITEDCLPLKSVWIKHYCTSESEIATKLIAEKKMELKSYFQRLFNEAVKKYNFEDLEAFVMKVENSKGVSFHHGRQIEFMLYFFIKCCFFCRNIICINRNVSYSK